MHFDRLLCCWCCWGSAVKISYRTRWIVFVSQCRIVGWGGGCFVCMEVSDGEVSEYSVKQLFARMYPTPDWLVPEIQLASEALYCSRMSWVQGGVQKTTVQLYLLLVQAVERRQDFNCLVLMILLVVFLLVLPCFLSLTFSSLLHFSVLH